MCPDIHDINFKMGTFISACYSKTPIPCVKEKCQWNMCLLVFYIYSLFCGDPLAMCMRRIEKWKFIEGLRYHHAILKTVDYWLFQHEKKVLKVLRSTYLWFCNYLLSIFTVLELKWAQKIDFYCFYVCHLCIYFYRFYLHGCAFTSMV